MSELSLRECETEVERARAKLARDLAVFRSPATVSAFTDDLKREALDAKGAVIDKLKSTAESVADDLKAKAAANPTAAMMISAGIAWRVFRNPPIASLLVGAGLFGLWRTQVRPGPRDTASLVRQGRERLAEQVSAFADTAGQKATEAYGTVSGAVADKASQVMEATSDRLDQWRVSAGEAAEHARAVAADTTAQALEAGAARLRESREQANRFGADAWEAAQEVRAAIAPTDAAAAKDVLLRGMANVALVAAIGLMFQKRAASRTTQQ